MTEPLYLIQGGVVGAERGTLSFLVGNPADKSDPMNQRILSIVSMMGLPEKVSFCGPIGTGTAVKIANNSIAACTMMAITEAMSTGIRAGIDKHTLYECIRTSTGQSWVLENMQPCPGLVPHAPSSNGYKVSFLPSMMVKDVSLGVEASLQVGIKPTMLQTALQTFKATVDDPRTKVSASRFHLSEKVLEVPVSSLTAICTTSRTRTALPSGFMSTTSKRAVVCDVAEDGST
jgi:3-hydroxyisobutyrate dehydrogenase